MQATAQFKNNKGNVIATISSQLTHGFLHCKWHNKKNEYVNVFTEFNDDIIEYQFQDFDYCLSDFYDFDDVGDEGIEIIVASLTKKLCEYDLKKLSLVGLDFNNKTHQEIYNVLVNKGFDIEVLSSLNQAIQCLLLPDHDEPYWDHVPIIQY